MPNAHIQQRRRGRFRRQWSLLNAALGGVAWREHPNLRLNARYEAVAPYAAPSQEWARFMAWYTTLYWELWENGGSSWSK